ncbi:MAG TPA: hypothetical protein VMS64_15315 [Candidatus Methylomirabilis sp.]|nr:hypothetical protein [Candidatus Methylomirabilis sp.]
MLDHVVFHKVRPSNGWPGCVPLAPRERVAVRLSLSALAPRVLRLVFFDFQGRDLRVAVDGRPLGETRAGWSGGRRMPLEIPLPTDVPDTFVAEMSNPGAATSALSEIQIRYAAPGGSGA